MKQLSHLLAEFKRLRSFSQACLDGHADTAAAKAKDGKWEDAAARAVCGSYSDGVIDAYAVAIECVERAIAAADAKPDFRKVVQLA